MEKGFSTAAKENLFPWLQRRGRPGYEARLALVMAFLTWCKISGVEPGNESKLMYGFRTGS